MKRLVTIFAVLLAGTTFCTGSATAQDFSLEDFSVTYSKADSSPATEAGSHPFEVTTTFDVANTVSPEEGYVPSGAVKNLTVSLPPGFVGDTQATPRCDTVDFTDFDPRAEPPWLPACPASSAVGIVTTRLAFTNQDEPRFVSSAVYNLVPPKGMAAMLGFVAFGGLAITVELRVNPSPPHNIVATLDDVPQPARFFGSVLTIWGNPSDPAHDPYRAGCLDNSPKPTFEISSTGNCPSGGAQRPFLTMPRSCTGPLASTIEASPWENPAFEATASSLSPGMIGCSKLPFEPTITAAPTTRQAESASGLDFNLDFHDEGLTDPKGIAQSDIRKAVVTLPEGVTLNPSAAQGLATCSPADLERETVDSEPRQGCPEASKVGSVEVETPLLEGSVLHGSVYVATPHQNPFDSLLAIYMVIKDPGLGILVKLPGRVVPDPITGQLVTTFGDPPFEVPQFPFSHFNFHFREGPRAPLVTPPLCGEYTTKALFTPWAKPDSPYPTASPFQVTAGVGGGPCPAAGIPPFTPGFEAGTINNQARSYSPFTMRLTRHDGDQDMTRFSAVLPPGVVGKIAGVAKCPQTAVQAAKRKTGLEELASPSCPGSSRIGRTLAGAGVGSTLTYVPGALYLGGPYHGDPLSVVAIVPAVAGPFDVGTVVVQEALTLNPDTAEVEVDGSASDPIPHILAGIPLKVRDVRVYADKPEFTLNPTSCAPSSARAMLWGGGNDVFGAADDFPVPLSARFQAAGCASLGFKPKLAIKLEGGTKRGAHPALKAVVTPRAADANFGKAVVALPHSAFLDQGHIRTVCTRVQFAARGGNGAGCPAAARYGQAKAWTPLLDEPLKGPVYLRSSNHSLPDLVVALHGVVDINLDSRIDSVHGGIRSTFVGIPDAPVSRFVLEMQGGRKGLIVNSTNLCGGKHHAEANLTGQNGKRHDFRPAVRNAKC
jgi:hypothetical protein